MSASNAFFEGRNNNNFLLQISNMKLLLSSRRLLTTKIPLVIRVLYHFWYKQFSTNNRPKKTARCDLKQKKIAYVFVVIRKVLWGKQSELSAVKIMLSTVALMTTI